MRFGRREARYTGERGKRILRAGRWQAERFRLPSIEVPPTAVIPANRLATSTTSRSFVDEATADTWLTENDPEGVAFEYEVME